MKRLRLLRVFLLLIVLGPNGFAGQKAVVETKETQPQEESWQFKLDVPIWLAGIAGQTGVKGKQAGVDVGIGPILRHLNFITSLSAEARKGRLGFYADFLYLDDRAGTSPSGLVSSLALRTNEYLADAEVNWRVVDSPKGWIEVRAGCRYTNLYDRLGLSPNTLAIAATSVNLTNAAAADVRQILANQLSSLDGRHPVLPVPPLAAGQKERLLEAVQAARADPELAAALKSGVQARIDQAKSAVQRRIAGILEQGLSRTFSLGQDWFDPYVGVAARYNIAPAFYALAKADIGGFGVGSQFTWQAYGAVGCQITRRVYSEAGYRWLYVDYRNGGFIYDVATRGAQIVVGVVF